MDQSSVLIVSKQDGAWKGLPWDLGWETDSVQNHEAVKRCVLQTLSEAQCSWEIECISLSSSSDHLGKGQMEF